MTALVLSQVGPGRAVALPRVSPRPAVQGRGARSTPGLRLTTRGRAILVALVLLVGGAVFVTTQAGAASADGPVGAVQVERHVVQPGETLWQIARGVAAPGQDVRDVVLELVELNGLPSSGLMAGQTIVVPSAPAGGTDRS